MSDKYIFEQIIDLIHSEIRRINSYGEIVENYGNTPDEYDPFIMDREFFKTILSRETKPFPDIFWENEHIYYALITLNNNERILIGPIQTISDMNNLGQYMVKTHKLQDDSAYRLPFCDINTFLKGVLLINHFLTGQKIYITELFQLNGFTKNEINIAKNEIRAIVFHHREDEVPHNPYDHEVRKLDSIQQGDLDELIKCQKEIWVGKLGKVANSPVRQAKNMAIIVIVLASRAAIKGGVSPELAFSMADGFILSIENNQNIVSIQAATIQLEIEFARAVKQLKKPNKKNRWVEKTKEYIFLHLNCNIQVSQIGAALGVNKDYLSSVFSREEGTTIQNYICSEKIKHSEELLKYSDYKIQEISNFLSFSSQSHFGQCFKRIVGLTPNQYRNQYGKR